MSEGMKKNIETKRLGLAAFLKIKGCKLVNVESKTFTFSSDKTLLEWELEYANSCCKQHDAEVCELRKLLTTK